MTGFIVTLKHKMGMNNLKTTTVSWTGDGLNFQATLGSGYEFAMGSPAGPQGGSPMEFLLAGVAGCTAVDVVSILRKMRQPIRQVTVEIQGARADAHPKVYTEITLVYVIHGDVPVTAVERAITLSQESYCSASIMCKRAGATLHTTYRIEP